MNDMQFELNVINTYRSKLTSIRQSNYYLCFNDRLAHMQRDVELHHFAKWTVTIWQTHII